MRILLIAITSLIASNAIASEPDNCEESLDVAIKILFINDALGQKSKSRPGANYTLNGKPNVCISSVSKNNKLYTWLIHQNVQSDTMIVESIDKKSSEKNYYGPLLSNPNELKQKLISDLKKRAAERGINLKSSDFNENK